MSGDRKTDGKDKGSWAAALETYRETWLRETGGVGSFRFGAKGWLENDSPTESSSVLNARITFKTLMTFSKWDRMSVLTILPNEGPPRASFKFVPKDREEVDAAMGLIAELIYRLAHTDEVYFAEIVRLKKNFDSMGLTRNEITMRSAIFLVAHDLLVELGRDPTRDEVLERLWAETKHRPSDTSSLFRESKLAFLKEKRGRPRKVPNRKAE